MLSDSNSQRSFFYAAFFDFKSSVRLFRYWLFSGFIQLQVQYQKTFFSYFWEALTVHFVASILALVWAQVLQVEDPFDYFLYILFGFGLWGLLSKLINKGIGSLSQKSSILTKVPLPISTIVLGQIMYCFLSFFIVLPFLFVWSFAVYDFDFIRLLVFFAGLLLIFVTAVGLSLTLGLLTFFYPDILQLVKAAMRLGFLVTPIIWKPSRLGEYADYVWFNPFFSYLEICRSALMGNMPSNLSWYIAITISGSLIVVAVCSLGLFHAHIRRGSFKL